MKCPVSSDPIRQFFRCQSALYRDITLPVPPDRASYGPTCAVAADTHYSKHSPTLD
jgi:hypothetical protein